MTLPVSMQPLTYASAEAIAVEVIACYVEMLCKWETADLSWFKVFQVQYEVFIDG